MQSVPKSVSRVVKTKETETVAKGFETKIGGLFEQLLGLDSSTWAVLDDHS